ncbi:RNase H family protein [Psychromicrobium sp. YIM B11713]|uniref:RNase H family protein n=1 Tax=Psychromicrobium sp. YIM B11713 TaxID=3145233 RepID=UPI00374F4D84
MTITAAADGSALGNPGPAGWAWYVDDSCWRAGGWPHGTNNQGELMAVLDLFRSTAHLPEEHLRILCDSQYVINCVTKWMPGWKRKGWRKADGKPVLNLELLREIDQELIGRSYEFEWVKGHAGHDLNEAADLRARAVATAFQNGTEPQPGPGFAGQNDPVTSELRPMALLSEADLFSTDEEPDLLSTVVEEPDLFSVLESDPVQADPIQALQECDRALLHADPSEAAILLAEDFEEIGSTGRFISRDAVLADSGSLPVVTLEPLSANLDQDLAVLHYRVAGSAGTAVQTSLWRRSTGQWRLQLRQTTPELD